MKHWRNFVLLLVILSAATYTAFWFYQASRTEKNLRESLASGPGGAKFAYESLSKSGFPFAIVLQIKNPQLAVPESLLNPFSARCTGTIVLSYNLLGQLRGAEQAPGSRLSLSIPGQELELAGMWKIDVSSQGLPQDTFRCTLDNFKLSERSDQGLTSISQVDNLQLIIKRIVPEYDRQIFDLQFSLKGLEYFAENSLSGLQSKEELLTKLASLLYKKEGKIDYSFGLELDLPSDQILNQIAESPLMLLKEPVPYFGLRLKNLTAQDNFSDSKANFLVSLGEEAGSTVKFEMALDAMWKYSATFYDTLMALLDTLNREGSSITDQPTKELITNRIDEVKALVPHFQDFGTIVSRFDTTASFNKTLLQGGVNLKEFTLVCDLYGIKLKGAATNDGGAYLAECTIEILKAQKLLGDIVGYYNRVYKVLNVLKSADAAELFALTQPTQDKIMAFLDEISTASADKSDLLIHIASHAGETKVGNLSLVDFRKKSSELWNAVLQEVAPSLVPKEPPQPETISK